MSLSKRKKSQKSVNHDEDEEEEEEVHSDDEEDDGDDDGDDDDDDDDDEYQEGGNSTKKQPARKRGRPPGSKKNSPPAKRKRGRPPKASTKSVAAATAAPGKRKRGRPPKNKKTPPPPSPEESDQSSHEDEEEEQEEEQQQLLFIQEDNDDDDGDDDEVEESIHETTDEDDDLDDDDEFVPGSPEAIRKAITSSKRINGRTNKKSNAHKVRMPTAPNIRRSPGRPRKNQTNNGTKNKTKPDGVDSKPPAKRSRGRPPSRKNTTNNISSSAAAVAVSASPLSPNSPKQGRRRLTKQTKPNTPNSTKSTSSSDDDLDDIKPTALIFRRQPSNGRRKSRRLRDQVAVTYKSDFSSSSDEDGNDNENDDHKNSAARVLPPRVSATLAAIRLRIDESSSSEQSGDENNENANDKLSSDEEFLDDDSDVKAGTDSSSSLSDGEDDDDDDDDDDSSEEEDAESTHAHNVDNEKLGTADSSDSSVDGDMNPPRVPLRQQNIPTTRTTTARTARSTNTSTTPTSSQGEITPLPRNSLTMDSDDEISEDPDYANQNNDEIQQEYHPTSHQRAALPDCPSKEDCITAAELSPRHVCYFSPDGKTRQCFALETLRRIALTSSIRKFHQSLVGEKQSFLQPPHFRSAMSAELMDQIASRFGRDALDINGEYYNRQNQSTNNVCLLAFTGAEEQPEETFTDNVRRYIAGQMGSRDVYVCPLCYKECQYRVKSNGNDEEDDDNTYNNVIDISNSTSHDNSDAPNDNDSQQQPGTTNSATRRNNSNYRNLTFSQDPMLTLSWVDDDFQIASACCFAKVADLKHHLRHDHNVETSGIHGNDLYMQYRIRAPDGLLQRFLKSFRRSHKSSVMQGDMRRYWYSEGNSQNYVYLLEKMEIAKDHRNILQSKDYDDDDENDPRAEAEEYFSEFHKFLRTFHIHPQKEWEEISGPFLEPQKDDINDFIANDDDDEEEAAAGADGTPQFLSHREITKQLEEEDSEEAEILEHLEQRYSQHPDDDDDDDDVELIDRNGNEVFPGQYSEVEESEDDDWVKNIRNKKQQRKQQSKTTSRRNGTRRASLQKKHSKNNGDDDDDDDSSGEFETNNNYTQPTPSPNNNNSTKRRAITEDSDDNDDDDDYEEEEEED